MGGERYVDPGRIGSSPRGIGRPRSPSTTETTWARPTWPESRRGSGTPSRSSGRFYRKMEAMEVFFDDEAGTWGYSVPSLNIIGGGCRTKEDAIRQGEESIRFTLEAGEDGIPPGSEVVHFRIELTPAS